MRRHLAGRAGSSTRFVLAALGLGGCLMQQAPACLAATFDFAAIPGAQFAAPTRDVFSGAWGDVDGDGRPDLFLAGLDGGPGVLLRNTLSGLVPAPASALTGDVLRRAGGAWGDVDNDGRPDLLVAGAYLDQDLLYRNLADGGFERLSPAGIESGYGICALWSDFDRDGHLDAFVVNGGGSASESSYVLRNDGFGRLVRVTTGALAAHAEYSHGAAFGDYDGDGDDDLLVLSAWNQPNALFRNEGDGTFTRVASGEVGSATAGGGGSAAWGDFDNDGDLDLAMCSSQFGNVIYRNTGGVLQRVPGTALGDPGSSVGIAWADFDDDGWLDLVIANRESPSEIHRNLGDGTFAPASPDAISRRSGGANGLAIADFDLDGDLDLWLSNWQGATPTTLFRNDAKGGNHLRLRLQGIRSNRPGIGAKIRVRSGTGAAELRQLRVIGGFDSLGSHELVAHFGLGQAASADVTIEWPSGLRQELPGVSANRVLDVVEPGQQPLTFRPSGGAFTNSVQVSMSSSIPGGDIRYTLDAGEPGTASAVYRESLVLTRTTTIKARVFLNGFPVSEVATAVYTRIQPIRFLPATTGFTNELAVTVVCDIPGTEIRYTLDGTDPTLASGRVEQPLRIRAATTVRARAFLNGFPVTDVVSTTYRRVYAFDDDGIAAAWRIQHFGADYSYDPRAAADADPDGDGSTNRQEFTVGSEPLNPLSGFRVGVRAVPEIRFASVPGKMYRILRLKSVPGGASSVVAEFAATATETIWVDTDAGVVANPAFYVVEPGR